MAAALWAAGPRQRAAEPCRPDRPDGQPRNGRLSSSHLLAQHVAPVGTAVATVAVLTHLPQHLPNLLLSFAALTTVGSHLVLLWQGRKHAAADAVCAGYVACGVVTCFRSAWLPVDALQADNDELRAL